MGQILFTNAAILDAAMPERRAGMAVLVERPAGSTSRAARSCRG
jgi:hypothetical protein